MNHSKSLNIFEKFAQADESISSNYGGLGVGLTIAKHNVELLGGEIFSKSKEGKGSVFHFNIEYTAATEEETKFNFENEDEMLSNKDKTYKVLVVDDEFVNILVLSKLIGKTEFNCKIYEAKNGLEAIEATTLPFRDSWN